MRWVEHVVSKGKQETYLDLSLEISRETANLEKIGHRY